MFKIVRNAVAPLAVAAAAACAGSPAPRGALTDAKSAVAAAEAVDAQKNAKARLHLKLARDQIAKAERLIEDDDNKEARRALERAQADAKLAKSLAKAADLRAEVDEAEARLEDLRRETL